jgi:F0F1-type ATP synthase membrane subunit c/vacuolar-type H+-ATPase subunit K
MNDSMDTGALRRLHYTAAIGCGVFAALCVHIVLSVFGVGLSRVLQGEPAIAALAWWAIAASGFVTGWATAAYLIAATRERELLTRIAQRVLIAVVFIAATAGGILSRAEGAETGSVAAGLTAFALGLVCAYCGARFAYLNAEQI